MAIGVQSSEIHEHFNKLFSAILMEQQKFDHIKPADEDKKELLTSKLKEYEQLKGRGFFFPSWPREEGMDRLWK